MRSTDISMRAMGCLVVVCLLAILSGCIAARNINSLPADTATAARNGFAIAEVYILGGSPNYMEVIVDQHTKGSVQDNFYAVELPPGEYTLGSLTRPSGGSSGGFGGVSVTLTEYFSYPLGRKFSVHTGEVTNLGQIIIAPDPSRADGKGFNIVYVDNSSDALSLLKAHYPHRAMSLKSAGLVLAPGDYVRGEDLLNLRRYISSVLAAKSPGAHYVAGPAGTLARVERAKGGKPASLQLIDAGMITGLFGGGEDRVHDRFAFTSGDGKVFLMREGQIQQRSLPDGVSSHNRIFLAGDRNVVVAAGGFNLYTSVDDGATWTAYTGAAAKPENDYGNYNFAKDDEGFFVYRVYPARIAYSPMGSPNYQLVPLPQDAKEIRQLTLLKSNILLEVKKMVWSAESPVPFYVRARSGGEWQTRYLPGGLCGPLIFLDGTGKNLRTVCGPAVNESSDGGEHWSARQ